MLDPHSAVGVCAGQGVKAGEATVALATAHPAKFAPAVERACSAKVILPPRLSAVMEKDEHFTPCPNEAQAIKDYLLQHSEG